MELLGWDRSNLHFVRTGRLQCYTILDHLSLKRVKTVKYISVHAVLVSRATVRHQEEGRGVGRGGGGIMFLNIDQEEGGIMLKLSEYIT